MKPYDAIIIGAGPAGLALGSELSKKHSILVVEKTEQVETHKSWIMEKSVVEDLGLAEFISATFKKSYVKSYEDEKIWVELEGACLDEERLFEHFAETIRKNGSEIKTGCAFNNETRSDDGLTVNTSCGTFQTKLLIDCSGIESPLPHKYKIYGRLFYYTILGEVFDNVDLGEDGVVLWEPVIPEKPLSVIEVTPTYENNVVFNTFSYRTEPIDHEELREIHERNIKECSIAPLLKDRRLLRTVYGSIPLGVLKINAVDNIFFFGDTSLIGAPIVGSGFAEVMKRYKQYAAFLSEKLEHNSLTEADLQYPYTKTEEINRKLQLVVGSIILNAEPEHLNQFVGGLSAISNEERGNLIFLRLTAGQVCSVMKAMITKIGLTNLVKLLPKNEYLFVIEQGAKIMKDLPIEKAKAMWGR